MFVKNLINRLLDFTIIFSFDRSGFKRHCPDELKHKDLHGQYALITGASSGIGLATSKALIEQKMSCQLIARDIEPLKILFNDLQYQKLAHFHSLDMSLLKQVYLFALNEVKNPLDLLIHNAGSMPNSLKVTEEGLEHMFASQVIAPFILTRTLMELGKLQKNCKVIFVSSGGMYLKKLNLSDLWFEHKKYNKYVGYANAKRAQVILAQACAKHAHSYLFSSMHPGWVDTPGIHQSMPTFEKFLKKRLRTPEEGADTILWLTITKNHENGHFWFDRKKAKDTILGLNKHSQDDQENLWNYCETIFQKIKKIHQFEIDYHPL